MGAGAVFLPSPRPIEIKMIMYPFIEIVPQGSKYPANYIHQDSQLNFDSKFAFETNGDFICH